MNPNSNRINAGLGEPPVPLPGRERHRPELLRVSPALNAVQPPIWDGTRVLSAAELLVGQPRRQRAAEHPVPGFLNTNVDTDISISLTKVAGRHTMKTGFYNTHSFKAEQTSNNAFGTLNFSNDTSNPLDTSFGFANAALGIFSSYAQASKFVEGSYIYNNTEGYIQDNWKVNRKLTLDYGVRLVHQQPQYDTLGQASNFLPDKWTLSAAPVLYVAGLRQRRLSLHGHQPPGHESADGPVPRPEHHAGHRRARAELRQPDERPVPGRQGHRQHDLQLARARRGAALRHGL